MAKFSLLGRNFRYGFEYLIIWILLSIFKKLSLDVASSAGGWLAELIGPKLGKHSIAKHNITMIFPDWSEREVNVVLKGMWNNLGRVVGEYPHLNNIDCTSPNPRIELLGREHVQKLTGDNVGAIMVSGHMGNWELLSSVSAECGLPLLSLYRSANNPHVEKLLINTRSKIGGTQHPKSIGGVRALIKGLQDRDHVGMLIDQKYNEGVMVPFLGQDAMTTDTPAALAIRFKVPIVPARVERLSGAYFRVTVLPPMLVRDSGDIEADKKRLTEDINKLFSDWIVDKPEQWLWLHRRWPLEVFE